MDVLYMVPAVLLLFDVTLFLTFSKSKIKVKFLHLAAEPAHGKI